MDAIEKAMARIGAGIPRGLAIFMTAGEYGETTAGLAARMSARRRRPVRRVTVTTCIECGTLPAEHNGRCASCCMCVASEEA
jgi:F0F1-type ATP synthase membrane subunit c/vacuolar-type H+-ATPase subunit K